MQGIYCFLHGADGGESIGSGLQIGRLRTVKVFVAFDLLEKAARLVFFRRRFLFAVRGKISTKTCYLGQPAPGKNAAASGDLSLACASLSVKALCAGRQGSVEARAARA